MKQNDSSILLLIVLVGIVIFLVMAYTSGFFNNITGKATGACSDPDQLNVKVRGIATSTGVVSTKSPDKCANSLQVKESYCSSLGVVASRVLDCPPGHGCSEGKCVITCGDGICADSESCEWYRVENRQMRCDGQNSVIPSGGLCSSCVFTPPSTSCGNGVCEWGESCEWNGAFNRQMLCDGTKGIIPAEKSCSACTLSTSMPIIIRQRIGVNQFIEPNRDTLATFQQELNDPKFTVFRMTYTDYLYNTVPVRNDFKTGVQDAVSRNKLVIISFQTFANPNDIGTYDQNSRNLNSLLADVEPKENIIVNVMNEEDTHDFFGTWQVINDVTCPPISPLQINPSSAASQAYLTKLRDRVAVARVNIDPRIRFMANPAWYYDHQYLKGKCPGWETTPAETWSTALVRYHAFLDAFDEHLDVLGLNYYPEGTESTIVNVVASLKQRYGMPVMILETGKGAGNPVTGDDDNLRKQRLIQEFAALNNPIDIPAIIVYYDRDDYGFGIKKKDGVPKGSYSAVPSTRDTITYEKPSWCRRTFRENNRDVCDIAYQQR